jgi:hypothetical protein
MMTIFRWSLQAAVFAIVATTIRIYLQTGYLPNLPLMPLSPSWPSHFS